MKKTLITFLITASAIASANDVVSRVIYSEASDICSSNERYMVASVIKNRIGHPGFKLGKLKTMKDVVTQKGAFSCIGDSKNRNWKLSKSLTNKNKAFKLSTKLATVDFKPYLGVVYYHDKSLDTFPKSWNNRYWRVTKALETKHFVFYRISPNQSKYINIK